MSHPALVLAITSLLATVPTAGRAEAPVAPPAAPSPSDAEGPKVAKKVAGRTATVKGCYESAIRADVNTPAKVQVSFTVGTQGAITQVEVEGAGGTFKTCIEKALFAVTGLPMLPAPRTFRQSFTFAKP